MADETVSLDEVLARFNAESAARHAVLVGENGVTSVWRGEAPQA
jgi:hypothetical protein